MTRSDQMRMAKSVSDTGRLGCKGPNTRDHATFLELQMVEHVISQGEWHKMCWTDGQKQII